MENLTLGTQQHFYVFDENPLKSLKIYEHLRTSVTIPPKNENRWKSMKINEIHEIDKINENNWKSMIIDEDHRNSKKIYENQKQFVKSNENKWTSMKIWENLWTSLKIVDFILLKQNNKNTYKNNKQNITYKA